MNALLDDGDFDAVDSHLAELFVSGVAVTDRDIRGIGKFNVVAGDVVDEGGILGFLVYAGDVVIFASFLYADGVAVEVFVGEKRGDVPKIHDGEVVFPEVFIDSGAASDDLLELGHGADVRIENDELASLGIYAGGHELRCGRDDRVDLGWADEVIEVAFALFVVSRDLHHVFAVHGDEVGVGVGQFLAHTFGVLDIDAEDDGFGEAVATLEELGNLLRDKLTAFFDHEVFVEIGAIIATVFDFLAVLVLEALWRAPALSVDVQRDFNDLVGREKAVIDPLLEGVGVKRIAEILGAGGVLGFLGCGGETDVGGFLEVFENFAPLAVLAGTATMALVNDDEVEEAWAELLVGVVVAVRAVGKPLVKREVDVVGGVDLLVLDDGHRVLEVAEVTPDSLVNQRGAVGQKEDAFFQAALPKTVDDLESGVGLTCARRHDEEVAFVAFVRGNRFDGAVNGDLLVVAGYAACSVSVVFLSHHRFGGIGDSFVRLVFVPEHFRARKSVQGEFSFDC